jgi:pentatricopeptide repeat protein
MNRLLKVGGIWIVFLGNSLVDMYAKFGSMEDANNVFNEMPSHDVVTWNVMICEVWTRAGGTGTIPTNAARRSAASPCHFRGCAEFMCQFNRT